MKVIVGIPSYNNAETIEHVIKQAAEGLKKYFDGGLIINSDGGSNDGTRDVVMKTPVPDGVEVRSTVYKWPIPGKGSAMKEVLEIARDEGADAVVFVDSDLRSITPEWVYKFAKPIEEGYHFVAPLYLRHKYDGTITNNIAYPMTTSLYGYNVRQPIGGDFGISADLIDTYLCNEEVWKTDVARFGVDIFLTTTAIAEGFKVIQTALGVKIHDPKDPAASLGPMFNQVVGTLFMLMQKYEEKWKNTKTLREVPVFGEMEIREPEHVRVTLELLEKKSEELFAQNRKLLEKALSKETFEKVKTALRSFDLDEPLIPLYFAKTADFVKKTKDMTTAEAEKLVLKRAEIFLEEKDYLLERW